VINLSEELFGEALAHHRAGRLYDAVAVYEEMLVNQPNHPDLLNNFGACLMDLGRVEASADLLFKAVELRPDDADFLNNLGNALQRSQRVGDAIAYFGAAAARAPRNAVIRLNFANALLRLGDYEAGIDQLALARELDPGSAAIAFADAQALPVIYDSEEQVCRARARVEDKLRALEADSWTLIDPASEVGLTNFYLPYQGRDDRDLQERLAQAYIRACPALTFTSPHCQFQHKRRKGRIRIGFVSAHLGSHTIGKLFQGLIDGLDRTAFEVISFSLSPDSAVSPAGRGTADKEDHVVPIPSVLKQAQELIAAYEPDILYYPDIGMEPVSYFLAFARLAPVQCACWGHPVTSGIPNIDYFLSWSIHEPAGSAAHYSEQLKVFDGFCTHYLPPIFGSGRDRGVFGLPQKTTLYLCPQSLFKIHPGDDHLWGDILRQDPNGRIIFLGGQEAKWGDRLAARFRRTLPDVVDRIDILPRLSGTDFFHILQLADVILDTPRWSGGRTSFEAAAAGKVVVTLPGEFMRGRFTMGLYRHMGLEDLVANSPRAYVELAVRLGTDGAERARQEARLRERSHHIFNNFETIDTHQRFFKQVCPSVPCGLD